jgi:hypothetical protein
MNEHSQERKYVLESIQALDTWVQKNHWQAYDTFDGLASPAAKYFTFGNPLLKQIWQQGVRRFPLNLRPLLGIKPSMSTKGMAFFAQGYLRLFEVSADEAWLEKMKYCLSWLIKNRCPEFRGFCWGNHFDYQSRGGNISKGTPTIVWTGLIGHAFLDAYESIGTEEYLEVAKSACGFILDELGWIEREDGVCLQYYPKANILVHNSSMIGASLIARTNSLTGENCRAEIAERAVQFTVTHQTEQGGWYYGVGQKWAWIDSFHTGYVLEALHVFSRYSGSKRFEGALAKGYKYFIDTFFQSDGTPAYYDNKILPIDIQCASQGVQTLCSLNHLDERSMETAVKVGKWTISNMQDPDGYFYYRKYPFITNKTPTLHWGQATMFAALGLLYQKLHGTAKTKDAALCMS